MNDIFQAVLAIFLCVLAFFIIQHIKRKIMLPLKCGSGVTISIVIEASGSAPCLESTLRCAELLQDNCLKATYIIINDDGLDDEPRRIAELFVAKNPLSELRRTEATGDRLCRQKNSTFE